MGFGGNSKGEGGDNVTIWRKLRQNRAETLVESLVSILIVALASTMLLTAVATASRLNQTARESQEDYQSKLEAAETGAGTPGGTVIITNVPGEDADVSVSVTIYGDEDGFVRWE
jgi:type II secretory pathway pseudopilin PulG